jgi:hypothetical protein
LSLGFDLAGVDWDNFDDGSLFWIGALILYCVAEFAIWLLCLTVLSLTYAFFAESKTAVTVPESRSAQHGGLNRRRRRQLHPE